MKVSINSTQPQYDYQFSVADHGIVGVVGLSGSGKSSLLNAIAGYQDKKQGTIVFNNKALDGIVKCSYMNQHPTLFPHWSVLDNLNFALKYSNTSLQTLNDLVAQLDCTVLLDKMPDKLSGGERQRIAFIRALLLIQDNTLVLLDEPFSALDNKLRTVALNLLDRYKKDNLIFLVTHKISELYQTADELLYIKEGKIDYQNTIKKAMASGRENLPLASKITLSGVSHVIYADDVSIGLHKSADSSIVHQLESTVEKITINASFAIVQLKLTQQNKMLLSTITLGSLKQLKLEELQQNKQVIFANFKATASAK